jgi:hypothetical protein
VTREAIYGFIAAEKTTYPVRLLWRVLQVSTSAFYDWIGRGQPVISEDDLDDAHAANQLHDAWAEHRRTYGARRLTAEIHGRGQHWNRKKGARLMTVAGIEGIHRRRHGMKRSRVGAGSVAPDLAGRKFVAEAPDQLWVADISYLRTWEGFLYLAVILDACTRRVVGWAMADHLRRELVLDALGMALHQRKPTAGLIHHSDHGVQGGFNRSSQHLDHGGVGWGERGSRRRLRRSARDGSGLRIGRCARQCAHRAAPSRRERCRGSSGDWSRPESPRSRPPNWSACRRQSGFDGFDTLAG